MSEMSEMPPILPKDQPPIIPVSSPEGAGDVVLNRFIIPFKVWFTLAMINGLAVGRARATWQEIAEGDLEVYFLHYAFLIFAVLGSLGILFCIGHLVRWPARNLFLGMRRSYWLIGTPLSWLFGLGIGLFWRYI